MGALVASSDLRSTLYECILWQATIDKDCALELMHEGGALSFWSLQLLICHCIYQNSYNSTIPNVVLHHNAKNLSVLED